MYQVKPETGGCVEVEEIDRAIAEARELLDQNVKYVEICRGKDVIIIATRKYISIKGKPVVSWEDYDTGSCISPSDMSMTRIADKSLPVLVWSGDLNYDVLVWSEIRKRWEHTDGSPFTRIIKRFLYLKGE